MYPSGNEPATVVTVRIAAVVFLRYISVTFNGNRFLERHMKARTLATAIVMTLCTAPLAAQDSSPRIEFSGIELTIGGRVQTQFNTTSIDGVEGSELILRRARIEIEARLNDFVSLVLEPDFGGEELDMKDTYVQLSFDSALQVIAGKSKRPFSRVELTSSKRILPVERGLRIRGLGAFDEYALVNGLDYSDREIGVLLSGQPEDAPLGLGYAVGMYRGPLHGEIDAATYQYVARVTLAPTDMLSFGASWSSRDFAESTAGAIERGNAFEIDVEYGTFAPGLHVIAEAAFGDVDPFNDTSFRGAQGWLAWRSGALGARVTAIEPLARVSWGDIESDIPTPGGILFTPGFNVYFGPLNRLMVNYDIWRGASDTTDAQSLKIMLQAAF